MKKISIVLCVIAVVGCDTKTNRFSNTDNEDIAPHTMIADSLGGIWNLYKVNDTLFDITKVYGYETDQPNLKIEVSKNLISGFSGCNSFSANASFDSTSIELTEGILATEIGCAGNIWENAYFSRLADIRSFKNGTDTLKIFSSDHQSMTFLRRHLHMLELNAWELTKVNDTIFDIKKVLNNPNESQPVIVFNLEKNEIRGWNGCHNFRLRIDFKEGYFKSRELSDTRECYEDWTEEFHSILNGSPFYKITGNVLTLTNTKGKTLAFKKSE